MRISDVSSDVCSSDLLAGGLPAGGFEHVLKDVVALPPRRLRERRPVRGFAVSGDQPLQRCDACCALLSARRAADRRLILGIKLRRAECCRDADSRASADTDVPDGSAVACRLAVEVGRARPWHQNTRSAEHTYELQSLIRISYAV